MNTNSTMRGRSRFRVAAVGCGTAAAVVLGVAVAPAAHADTRSDSLRSTVGGLLDLGGASTPAPTASTPGLDVLGLVTIGGSGSGAASGTTTGTTPGSGLVDVGSNGSGLTVDVGNGLATVGVGGGSTGSGVGVGVTVGADPHPTDGSVSAGVTVGGGTTGGAGGGSSSGGTTSGTGGTTTTAPAPAPATPAVAKLISATVGKSMAIIYPKKDGYRDSMTFLVDHATSTGAVVPVTGSALLTKAGRTVKTWTLVRSTQKLAWNGLVNGALKPGAYTLTATAKAADGVIWKSSTGVTVSAKKLVTKAVALRTGAVKAAKYTTRTMPKAARSSLVKGLPVKIRITTVAKGLKGAGRLVFTDGTRSFSVPVKNGTHTTKSITVPKTYTKVHMKPVLKAKHGTVTAVRLVWNYGTLK